jgi:hypothetical protein
MQNTQNIEKYRAILPQYVQNWDNDDLRYKMKSGIAYRIVLEYDKNIDLFNPNFKYNNISLSNTAHFFEYELAESFTKEEKPEYFL